MAAVSACTRRVTHGWTSARVRRVRSKKEAAHTHPATAASAAACHLVRPAPAPVPKPTTAAASMSNSKRRGLAPLGPGHKDRDRISAPQRVEEARWDRSAGGGRTLVAGRRRPRRTGSSGSRGKLDLDGWTGGRDGDRGRRCRGRGGGGVGPFRSLLPAAPRSGPAAHGLGLGGLSFFSSFFCFVVVSLWFNWGFDADFGKF